MNVGELVGFKKVLGGLTRQEKKPNLAAILADCLNLIKVGDYHGAIEGFDLVIEQNLHCADAYYGKGLAFQKLGQYKDAIQCFDKTLELDPKSTKALFQKGNNLAYLARFEEAIQCYNKVLELDLQHAEAWSNKGICYQHLGERDKVDRCMEEAARARGQYQCRLHGGG